MVGLTGDLESVKAIARKYRVYYNKTDDHAKDYLVDHSIITVGQAAAASLKPPVDW